MPTRGVRRTGPALLALALVACEGGVGSRCSVQNDCAVPLICARDHTCQKADVVQWDQMEAAKRQQLVAGELDRLRTLEQAEQRLAADLAKEQDAAKRGRIEAELGRTRREREALERRLQGDLPPRR